MPAVDRRARLSGTIPRFTRAACGLGGAVLLAHCGGSALKSADTAPEAELSAQAQAAPPPPPAAEQPESFAEPPPDTTELDALMHDLAVAKERLDRELSLREEQRVALDREEKSAGDRPAAAPGALPPSPARKPAAPAKSKQAESERREERAADARGWVGSTCDTACRALSSMRRSSARICELSGATDARCEKAQALVKDSAARVEASGCACRPPDD
jgi:hypothetical protein